MNSKKRQGSLQEMNARKRLRRKMMKQHTPSAKSSLPKIPDIHVLNAVNTYRQCVDNAKMNRCQSCDRRSPTTALVDVSPAVRNLFSTSTNLKRHPFKGLRLLANQPMNLHENDYGNDQQINLCKECGSASTSNVTKGLPTTALLKGGFA